MKKITLDKLEKVIGGTNVPNGTNKVPKKLCPICNELREFRTGSGGRAYCKVCNEEILY